MDRPTRKRRNGWPRRLRQQIITALALIVVVLGIALLPILCIYFWGSSGKSAGSIRYRSVIPHLEQIVRN